MKLRNILDGYNYILIQGNEDVNISGIENDSRKVKKGDLFIAEVGYTVDGHDYIEKAIENGASAILVEKDIVIDKDICIIKVGGTIDAMAYVASKFYDEVSKKLHLVGITGTNGKTSTTYFIKSIFENLGVKSGLIGTMGSMIGNKKVDHENTTPNSLINNRILSDMLKEGIGNVFMEVSSHALDLDRVKYMDFEVGVFTNLAKDHLDYHKTIDNYFNSKLSLFKATKSCNIVNIDDPYGKQIIDITRDSVDILSYGIYEDADVKASNLKFALSNISYDLTIGEDTRRITLNIPGKFSVYNSLAAAAVAYYYGLEIDDIKIGLEKIEGIKGRFEVVPTNEEFTVIIDFAHTADGLEKVLEVIDEFVDNRKIVLFGAGGDRDKSKRPEMGEVVGRHADISIVTSDNPRTEKPDLIIEDIILGIERAKGEYVAIIDRVEAIKYAMDIGQKGDIILLAGKGHETYTIIGKEKIPCDERKIVIEYLEEKEKEN